VRTVDGYLSRRAQQLYPGAIVTHDDKRDYRIERPDAEPLGLGDSFSSAHTALTALHAAHRQTRSAGE